jgi:O-antigen/teichoic acid export membrane protein
MNPSPPVVAAPEPRAAAFAGRSAARAVRWSTLSVLGRQGAQMAFALIVARMLGPELYGAISAATVYVTLSTLLLDQGVSAALVQRRELPAGSPGAAATVNLALAVVLGLLTWVAAPLIGGFFRSAELPGMLVWLAGGLLLKAAAIAPRALSLRHLALKQVAAADIAGAGLGAVVGITAAALGAGPAAMVVMTLLGDAVTAAVLLATNRGPVPNLRFAAFRPLVPFGARVFATNGVAYLSRNTDNVLVGRFLGVTALSYYSMGYRVLVIPVQLIGQSVNRVMFPVFSRSADRRELLAEQLTKATELLAAVVIPVMALLAVAAPQLVAVVLGERWLPAAPLMTVLAIAGARETIFYLTPALIRATGRAGLNLRFELLSTAVQVTGIVVGLLFGLLGVAVGYAVAGFALTPLLLLLQRRLTGVPIRTQVGAMLPPLHASAWGAGAYLLLTGALPHLPAIATLIGGGIVYAAVAVAVLRLAHPSWLRRLLPRLSAIAGARMGRTKAVAA